MNLVEQIFAQAQAGGAAHPGDSQSFFAGISAAQDQQRIDTAKRQLAAELAMQPITMTLKQQEADMNALKLEAMLRDNQEAIEGNSLVARYSKAMQGANLLPLESGLRVHSQFGLDNPAILSNPQYQAAGKQLDARVRQAELEQYRLQMAEAATTRAQAALERVKPNREEILPKVVDVRGVPMVVNPRTGHFEPLDKMTKQDFVLKHATKYAADNMTTEDAAALALEKLYDSVTRRATPSATPGTSPVSTNTPSTTRFIWDPNKGKALPK